MIPSELMSSIVAKAKGLKRTVVFPDATDERAIQAARILSDQGIVQPILIGKTVAIQETGEEERDRARGIRTIDPELSDKLSDFSHIFFNLRKTKGIQLQKRRRQ